jgi:uncharacterized membrane protein
MNRTTVIAALATAIALSLSALSGCAADTSESTDPAADEPGTTDQTTTEDLTAKLTYKDTKAIINGKCGGCHGQFKSLAGIKVDKTSISSHIKAGSMPPGNPSWKSGADGKKVLSWLKSGADLK